MTRNSRSPEAAAYRHLYSLSAWRGPNGLRRQALIRDGFQCQMCGTLLTGRKGDDNAPEVDHIEDHKGDRAKFFSLANVQSLCALCHTVHKQRASHGTDTPAIGADGWPIP